MNTRLHSSVVAGPCSLPHRDGAFCRAVITPSRLQKRRIAIPTLCVRIDEARKVHHTHNIKRAERLLHPVTEVLRTPFQPESGHSEQPSMSSSASNDLLARAWQQLSKLNPKRLSPRVRGLILLNILVLLCGANWVVMKEAEDFLDPFTFAALRFSLAAVVFSPWIKDAVQDRQVLKGGFELGIWSALAYMLQSVGLVTSDASRASFLSTFTVSSIPQQLHHAH